MAVWFSSVKAVQPQPLASSWSQLKELLSFHEENEVKSAGALWSPVTYYENTTRGNRNVRFVESLVVDLDGSSFESARLDGLEWFAYSTYSHRLDDPHYHLVLPLAERVPAGLWRAVWLEMVERLNLPADPQTKDPARLFYLPQHAPNAPFEFHEGSGVLLDTSFDWDDVHSSRPVVHQARNPRRVRAGAEMLSEGWWASADVSCWAGLEGKELYRVMLAEWESLYSQLK
jgi:putative DNA primase/helicase